MKFLQRAEKKVSKSNSLSSEKTSQDNDLEGIEGILYLAPVIGIIFMIMFICSRSPRAMSWLTQCIHESVSLLVAVGFMGWFFWTLIRDKLADRQVRQRGKQQLTRCSSDFSRCGTKLACKQCAFAQ